MTAERENLFPKIGARIIKSAIAVFLCYVVNYFRGESGIVFYSQLSVLWCIQSYVSATRKNARQRIAGTLVGAVFGLVVLLFYGILKSNFNLGAVTLYVIQAVVTSLSVIMVLYTTVVLKKKQASYFSCVVFLSIVVIHFADANPFLFTLNRFIDTMVGIVIGVFVNLFHLPRKQHKDILFISGLDDTLLNADYHINDYCKVELNRMIDEGLNFTLSTMRPPASIIEPMKDIKLKLPVIAMDGAVLFDANEKRFLEKIEMEISDSKKIKELFEDNGIIYFANVVIDDTLLIYFNHSEINPLDEMQRKLVKDLRKSPYRNYINRPLPPGEKVVYYMLFYPNEKAEKIHELLCNRKINDECKVLKYPSRDYPGYSYIKVFHKNAEKANMVELLKRRTGIQKVITFGTIPAKYDHVVREGDTNEVVHKIKRLFEK